MARPVTKHATYFYQLQLLGVGISIESKFNIWEELTDYPPQF